jgi:hypothetical protein
MSEDALLKANDPTPQQSPVPQVVRGLELAKLVRDPDNAALAAVELAKGRLTLERLTIYQALRLTNADPFAFMRLFGLKPQQRAALKLGNANKGKSTGRRRKSLLMAAD